MVLMSSSARLTSSARVPLLLWGENSSDDAVITNLPHGVSAAARRTHGGANMMTSGRNSV